MVDYYKKSRKIAEELNKNGFSEIGNKIIESVDFGTISTEILMSIRWNLKIVIDLNTLTNKRLLNKINKLVNEIDRILGPA